MTAVERQPTRGLVLNDARPRRVFGIGGFSVRALRPPCAHVYILRGYGI
ncbi:hypothetical protein ACIBL8_34380 [Streptomyces sp. NPDC050523]